MCNLNLESAFAQSFCSETEVNKSYTVLNKVQLTYLIDSASYLEEVELIAS